MKRIDLLRYLHKQGCELVREEGRYSWWRIERGDRRSVIPRRRQIDDLLAKKSAGTSESI